MHKLRKQSCSSRNANTLLIKISNELAYVLMTNWQLIFVTVLLCFAQNNATYALTPDGQVLLAFKAQMLDSDGILVQWRKEDPDPCQWSGVTCDQKTKRVTCLSLPYHKLRGHISPELGKLSDLQRLALHDNNLYGHIPPDLGNCTQLRALYLQDNFLSDSIPSELGKLSELRILDLSSNSLGDTIPLSLGKLTKLSSFNVSTNFLSGAIPSEGALSRFNQTSVALQMKISDFECIWNSLGSEAESRKHYQGSLTRSFLSELEPPFSSSEPPAPAIGNSPHKGNSKKKGGRYSTGLLISALVVVVVSLLVALMCYWGCYLYNRYGQGRRKPALEVNEVTGASVVIFHGDLPYSSKDILRKIEVLDEESIIGSGGFGTVYKLVMDDGNAFALKKIERTSVGSDRIFERELEILGSIKHRHLVNLRGYCNSPTAKLLIYDFLPGGNLNEVLHERNANRRLDWDARVKIAIGAAKGLSYLHHDCSPRIIHRDIKSSNILLDRNLESHVSDFGLAKLLVDQQSHITSTVAGTFGYLAPEYMHSGRATEKSDVYSFGVLLLELLSGKQPVDAEFIEKGLNIVGWLNQLLKESRHREIVDPDCEGVQQEVFEVMLNVAMRCVSANPEDRPTMHRIVQMLESEAITPCPSDFYDSE